MRKPLLAVTMGDAAGVGPEVIVGAWRQPAVHQSSRPFVIGNPNVMRRAVQLADSGLEVVEITDPLQAQPSPTMMPCLAAGGRAVEQVPPGLVNADAGQAAYDCLVIAARLAIAGRVNAITTAPLNKAALHLAGRHYPGHTELLAELCGVDDFAMMLYLAPGGCVRGPAGLGVVHVTLHMALGDALRSLSSDAIIAKILLADRAMRPLGAVCPRIGVAALNPHAGESGLFGDEEQRLIAPAVESLAGQGIAVQGPLAADTLMVRAAAGDFDAVVAMYHDQGHIALKLLGMHRAVNITLGLPIIRTSVAHGTAFDLAWRNVADSSSMVEALRLASLLCQAPRPPDLC